ncbi:AMP-binding protein [Brevibacterium sp. UBA7493]|uniref:AMP-binding protein n=1 Tax=Brevibacterium sp. UBA7493 TaxID=1946121 RepID=UPI00257A3301|nr:AMP-binding protein [Brevibacterium sp. UBA7493]
MDHTELAELLRRALAGAHTVVLPPTRDGQVTVVDPHHYDDAGTGRRPPALVVHTSGTTGPAKGVALSAQALTASARATEGILGGPGRWYLALPVNHIAGTQVVLRSLQAQTVPFAVRGPFTAQSFSADVMALQEAALHMIASSGPPGPLYTALVPTQLTRIMADPVAAELARSFDAILLGGAAISPSLLARAASAGLNIVRTYGMSETCGGCVYDGVPFADVDISIDDTGRVVLAGDVLADGYVDVTGGRLRALPDPEEVAGSGFTTGDDGARRFVTSDLGTMTDGVLSVLGRADDVVISGGENISPLAVENTLLAALEAAGVREVLITGVPDAEWGEVLACAIVTDRPGTTDGGPVATARALAERLTASVPDLPSLHRPVYAVELDALPATGLGKPDRRALRRQLVERLGLAERT